MINCENCRNWSPKNEKCRKGESAGVLCAEFAPYPMQRDLDGVYFRVCRYGKWGNVCFSDMTPEEIEERIGERPAQWWKSLACHMGERLRTMGDNFDIVCKFEDDE